jgi:hypothetical protein
VLLKKRIKKDVEIFGSMEKSCTFALPITTNTARKERGERKMLYREEGISSLN